jgi:hypothetical protein
VGEALEVSWAVHGHPTARWAATVRQVSVYGGGKMIKPPVDWLLVHFDAFSDEWDEVRAPSHHPTVSHARMHTYTHAPCAHLQQALSL